MLRHKGIAFKLVFLILVSDAAILAFIFGYNYRLSRQIIEKEIRNNARNLVRAKANQIDMVLLPIQKVPQNIASFFYGYHSV